MDPSTPISATSPAQEVTVYTGDDLAHAGLHTQTARAMHAFSIYRQGLTDNTRLRQHNDLESFCTYLGLVSVSRTVDELEQHPSAWQGITASLVAGFQLWLESQGYAVGTINVRLATIRQYCQLVRDADLITQEELLAIKDVKGKSGKTARNVDRDRQRRGVPTRIGRKKATATEVTTAQVFALKKPTAPDRRLKRTHDQLLVARDALLMGLLFEHALRCGEVAGLNLENFNLTDCTFSVYREKTDETTLQILHKHTRIAAETYLALLKQGIPGQLEPRTSGPLFTGYKGERLSKRAINARVGVLGKQAGIAGLSPHDARHFWAYDALRNGTPIDKVKSGGNWHSDSMPLRYAKRGAISNEGVRISEE